MYKKCGKFGRVGHHRGRGKWLRSMSSENKGLAGERGDGNLKVVRGPLQLPEDYSSMAGSPTASGREGDPVDIAIDGMRSMIEIVKKHGSTAEIQRIRDFCEAQYRTLSEQMLLLMKAPRKSG